MRALFVTALLLTLGADYPRHRRFLQPGLPHSAAYYLVKDYEWPWTGPRLPQASDPGLISYAGVGAVTGSTTTWESMGPDAGVEGTVTDRSCAVIDSFIPGVKALRITGTCSPKVDSTGIFNVFQTTHAHSVVAIGYSPEVGGYATWFAANVGYGYYGFYSTSGQGRVNDWDFNVVHADGTPTVAYGAIMSTYDGVTTMAAQTTVSTYATAQTVASRAAAWGVSDHVFWYGDRSAHDIGMNGPLVGVAVYGTNIGTDGFATIMKKAFGIYSPAGTAIAGWSNALGQDNTATTGNIDPIRNYGLITSQGLRTSSGIANTWSADALDLSTDTDIGTPTVNANVSSGPFAVWKGAAECDELVATNAAALDGKLGATDGTAVGASNAGVWLKAGLTGTTKTKATLGITVAGGTGSATLAITGLTSTAQFFSLKAVAAGGGITSIKPFIKVGTVIGETGSIQVCHRQHTASLDALVPGLDNAARGDIFYDIDPVADGWPDPAKGGCYEVVHVPRWDPLNDWVSVNPDQGTYYMFDASVAGGDHTVAMVFGYTLAGRVIITFRSLLGQSDQIFDGIGFTAGQFYATKACWRPVGGGKCKNYVYHNSCGSTGVRSCTATTLVSSDTTGTAWCPGTPTIVHLGRREGQAYPTSTVISAVRVSSL